jgi:hypothetical protein
MRTYEGIAASRDLAEAGPERGQRGPRWGVLVPQARLRQRDARVTVDADDRIVQHSRSQRARHASDSAYKGYCKKVCMICTAADYGQEQC